MKRLLYTGAILIVSGFLYASSGSSSEPFAGCTEEDCVTINGCEIECNECAGSGHDRVCEGITTK